jgi:hypothetical protein
MIRTLLAPAPALALFCALLIGCDDGATNTAPTTGSISGRVIDATTFRALAGARIETTPASASVLTDDDGRYTIPAVTRGSRMLRVTRDGYLDDSVEIQVTAGSATTADVALRRDESAETNNALEFFGADTPEGTDAGVRIPGTSAELADGSLTLEAWIQPTGFGDRRWNWVVSKGTTFNLLFGVVDGRLFLQAANTASYAQGATLLIAGRWYHVAGVRDMTTRKILIYLNGVLEAQTSIQGDIESVAGDLMLGKYVGGPDEWENGFQGVISEARIWTRALTPAAIATGMGRRANGGEPGLLHCWPLDEGSGTTVHDIATAGHDGVFVNSPEWTHAELPIE